MASIIKANQLQDFGGNSILTSDGAGNLTTQKINYPAFYARKTSAQTLTTNTYTKITFDSEIFDTDSAYGSDKFTVPAGKAGKYFIGAVLWCDANAVTNFSYANISLYKNGSEQVNLVMDHRNNYTLQNSLNLTYVGDLSVGDYLEVYGRISDTSGSPQVNGNSSLDFTYFYGYRIGS
jgi:uncharacterized protein YfaP (DUF2135 family)